MISRSPSAGTFFHACAAGTSWVLATRCGTRERSSWRLSRAEAPLTLEIACVFILLVLIGLAASAAAFPIRIDVRNGDTV